MSEQITVELPDDVHERLSELDSDRLDAVMVSAVEEALDISEDAQDRRDELREKMGLSSQEAEELAEDTLTDAERKRAELREKIRSGR